MNKWGKRHAEKILKEFFPRAYRGGFTVVELLVVIAVMAILFVITMSTMDDFSKRQQYRAEVLDVRQGMEEQRTKTIASLADNVYGFHVASTAVTFFTGDTYSAVDITNEVLNLSSAAATSSFSNGLSYVIFGQITGTSSATGTIKLYNSALEATTTFTIYETGAIKETQ